MSIELLDVFYVLEYDKGILREVLVEVIEVVFIFVYKRNFKDV